MSTKYYDMIKYSREFFCRILNMLAQGIHSKVKILNLLNRYGFENGL